MLNAGDALNQGDSDKKEIDKCLSGNEDRAYFVILIPHET